MLASRILFYVLCLCDIASLRRFNYMLLGIYFKYSSFDLHFELECTLALALSLDFHLSWSYAKIKVKGQLVQQLEWKQTNGGRTWPIALPPPLTQSIQYESLLASLLQPDDVILWSPMKTAADERAVTWSETRRRISGVCAMSDVTVTSLRHARDASSSDKRTKTKDWSSNERTSSSARVSIDSSVQSSTCSVLFCSLAVLDPRVGHTMEVLSPFIPVLCHSDWLFHGESCPRLDVVHPGRAWPSSPSCTWHCPLHYLFLQATPLFPHGVTIVC